MCSTLCSVSAQIPVPGLPDFDINVPGISPFKFPGFDVSLPGKITNKQTWKSNKRNNC